MFEKSKDLKFKIGSVHIGQGVDLLNKYFRLSLMFIHIILQIHKRMIFLKVALGLLENSELSRMDNLIR